MAYKDIRPEIEALTLGVSTINTDHGYIHAGKAFSAIYTAAGISAAYRIGFLTPSVASKKIVHWRPIGMTTSTAYCDITMTEAETYSAGTALTPFNRNRVLSTMTSSMQDLKRGVTCTPAGIVVGTIGIGTAGNASSRSGGDAAGSEELVLKANTNYCITLTPTALTDVKIILFWYEEDAYIPS